MPRRRATTLSFRAIIKAWDSLSITQGPAIRKRGCPWAKESLSMRTGLFIIGLTFVPHVCTPEERKIPVKQVRRLDRKPVHPFRSTARPGVQLLRLTYAVRDDWQPRQ